MAKTHRDIKEARDQTPCPDCGCPVWCHNAVNRTVSGPQPGTITAHCGGCGTCWKSTPEFIALVKTDIEKGNQRLAAVKKL